MDKWDSCKELFSYLCLNIMYDQLSTLVGDPIDELLTEELSDTKSHMSAIRSFMKNAESHFLSVVPHMDNEVGIEKLFEWKDQYEEIDDEKEPIGYLTNYLSTVKDLEPVEYNNYMNDVALDLVRQVIYQDFSSISKTKKDKVWELISGTFPKSSSNGM